MRERLRDDWRATSEAAKVVLTLVGAVCLLYGAFAVWFWLGYRV